MGNITNLIGCDCFRKQEDVNETEQNEGNKPGEKMPSKNCITQLEQQYIPPHSHSLYIKIPNHDFFDGKIDVKDYIQKGDSDTLGNYRKIKRVGQGSYGSVFKVVNKNTNFIRAMKKIPKNFQKDNQEILREIDVLRSLDHPNVMKIYEFLEDEKNYYLIEEFCDGGDLDTILNGKKIYCEFLVKFIMYQVFLAINYLHIHNIVHQDIKKKNITINTLENENKNKLSAMKPKDILKKFVKQKTEQIIYNSPIKNDNIFIKINEDKEIQEELNNAQGLQNLSKKATDYLVALSQTQIKVIDFGEAIFMAQKKKYIDDISGTINYLSPELIRGQMIKELDEWACGVLMYYLLVGHPPFDGKTEDEIFDAIMEQKLNLDIDELKNVSDECKDLISQLLERDITKRITAKKALEHNFFKTGIKIEKIVGGMVGIQTERAISSWMRIQKSSKKSKGMFKKAVIAYMALNFLEKEEEKKMKNIFYKLSKGNSKQIDEENFAKTIREVNDTYTDEEIKDLFNKLDENKNGVLEYEEIVRSFSDREKLFSEKNMKEAFNFVDKDKNGIINLEDISQVVFQNKKMPKQFVSQLLEEIEQKDDKNDVNITFEDFCQIMKKE